MNECNKRNCRPIMYIATFLIIFALLTDSFVYIIYKNRIVQIFTLLMSLFIFLLSCLKKFNGQINTKILALQVCWILTIPFVVFRNADLKSNSGSSYVIYYLIAIALLIVLRYTDYWIEYSIKFLYIGTNIYAFFTIIFKMFKPLYYNFISRIYSGAILTQLIQQYDENHMAGIASHYSTNAIYLTLGIGTIIFFYLPKNSKKKTYIYSLILLIIAFMFNGKRGTLIFCVLSILIVYMTQISTKNFKKLFKTIICFISIILIFSLVIYLCPSMQENIFKFLRLDTTKSLNDFSSGRLELYTRALEDFKINPIFGWGWGYYKHKYAYIYSYVGEGFYMDVHNIYIQLLCEVGIVGFIMFIIPITCTAKMTFRLIKKNVIEVEVLSKRDIGILKLSLFLQVFFILYGFTGNPLYDYWVFMIYILGVSMFFAINRLYKEKNINKQVTGEIRI